MNGNSATFVFTTTYDQNKPFSYLAIHLSLPHTFVQGWAAAVYGRVVKGVVMGSEYYMGDLGPKKMSSFYKILPKGLETTCITIYITV